MAVPVTLLLHKQFSGGSFYTPVTQTGQWGFLLHIQECSGLCYTPITQVSGGSCYTPITQTGQWRFLLHSYYTERSVAVPFTLLLHRQVSGDFCYTYSNVAASVTLPLHRQASGGSCYTPVTQRSVAVLVTQTGGGGYC